MPNTGDLAWGPDIGYKSRRYFRWEGCPKCEMGRWVKRTDPVGGLCIRCGGLCRYAPSRDTKIARAVQLLEENKEAVLIGTYGTGCVNKALMREFGSGLAASTVTGLANEVREHNTLTSRVCSHCNRELPLKEFVWGASYLRSICADCKRARDRAYYQQTRDIRCAGRKRVYHANPERILRRVRRDTSIYDAVKKLQVLCHYSDSKCACIVCGEDDPACLSIDHINGGGGEHRRRIGSHFYAWLIKQGFPNGYQTLCMNCQFKKRYHEGEFNNLEAIERRKENECKTTV